MSDVIDLSRPDEPARTRISSALFAFSGILLVLVAQAQEYLEYTQGQLSIAGKAMPLWVSFGLVCAVGFASVLALVRIVRGLSYLTTRYRLWVFGALGILALSLSGFWYGLLLKGPQPWEFREAIALIVSIWGVVLLAQLPLESLVNRLDTSRVPGLPLILAVLVTGSSAYIAAVLLHQVPPMNDAYDYILQSRALWAGYLSFPDAHQLFGLQSMTGKYPLGFPAILGLFDRLSMHWLANPFMAGLIVVVFYFGLRRIDGAELARTSVLVLCLSPWFVLNGSSYLSHVSTTFWLLCFVFALYYAQTTKKYAGFGMAGLFLGAALLTRPFDAAVYAVGAAALATVTLAKDFRFWLPRWALAGSVTLVAVLIYLYINTASREYGLATGYGNPLSVIGRHSPESLLDWLVWLHESLVAFSRHWTLGVFPASIAILVGLVVSFRASGLSRVWIACAAGLVLLYGLFIFDSRYWLGPRWYVPLIPLAAYQIARSIVAARSVLIADSGAYHQGATMLSRAYLRGIYATLLCTWLIATPFKIQALTERPPHGVDHRLLASVRDLGLTNAVVGVPGRDGYYCEGTKIPSYKIIRSAGWTMTVPFEDSPVLYVERKEGWEADARRQWPGRNVFRVADGCEDFTLIPVTGASGAAGSGE